MHKQNTLYIYIFIIYMYILFSLNLNVIYCIYPYDINFSVQDCAQARLCAKRHRRSQQPARLCDRELHNQNLHVRGARSACGTLHSAA